LFCLLEMPHKKMATARSTSDDAPSSPALPPACAPYVGRPLDASGRGGDGALAGYGDDLITTARATGRRKPALRRAPRRGGARRQLELGAVLARAEDGHSFLRALTPRALSAAINEGDLAPRAARRDAGLITIRDVKIWHARPRERRRTARAGRGRLVTASIHVPVSSAFGEGNKGLLSYCASWRRAWPASTQARRRRAAAASPDERHHRPRKIP
jgi:hypothetical protein